MGHRSDYSLDWRVLILQIEVEYGCAFCCYHVRMAWDIGWSLVGNLISTTLLRQSRTHGLKFAMTHVPVSHAKRRQRSPSGLHCQRVCHLRSERKEGHICLKVNRVHPWTQRRQYNPESIGYCAAGQRA